MVGIVFDCFGSVLRAVGLERVVFFLVSRYVLYLTGYKTICVHADCAAGRFEFEVR